MKFKKYLEYVMKLFVIVQRIKYLDVDIYEAGMTKLI